MSVVVDVHMAKWRTIEQGDRKKEKARSVYYRELKCMSTSMLMLAAIYPGIVLLPNREPRTPAV